MPLDNGFVLQHAYANHYAIPAFSVHDYLMAETVIQEAERHQVPVLLQIGQRAIRYGQMKPLADHIARIASQSSYPVVTHLDHCHDFTQIIQALRAGLTSCMIDVSHLPFEENVDITKRVVDVCHAVGVPVEGELGAIGGVEDDVSVADEDVVYTAPDAAEAYVRETGIDSLAVAIGSAHGMYKQEPHLDLARLEEISQRCQIPIVLHGGSGIPRDQIERAIALGISKINFDTELRLAYVKGLQAGTQEYPDDPFQAAQVAKSWLQEVIVEKITWCFPNK